ncbi:hypothetical protein CEXT_469451 [Caerostris extrusa]|uniref:Uncharacterized protein n=1 Tax=Caerostris extrusa TaxID=172846 RepID=A0AAV4WMM2_CAEEX|nr:hypothetical protein CEXT_469451 [Caerostris extrusa]
MPFSGNTGLWRRCPCYCHWYSEEFLGFWSGFPALFCVEQSRYGCGLDRLQRSWKQCFVRGKFSGGFSAISFRRLWK